jgi:hypothetical protein
MDVEKKQEKKRDTDFSVFIPKCLLHIPFYTARLYDALVQAYIIFCYTPKDDNNLIGSYSFCMNDKKA